MTEREKKTKSAISPVGGRWQQCILQLLKGFENVKRSIDNLLVANLDPRSQKPLKMLILSFDCHTESQSYRSVIVCVHGLIISPWR